MWPRKRPIHGDNDYDDDDPPIKKIPVNKQDTTELSHSILFDDNIVRNLWGSAAEKLQKILESKK